MGNQGSRQTLKDFESIRLLGKGAFGKVWLVKHNDTGELFAMKILDKESVVQQNLIEHTLLERDVMLKCNNPFIINMHCSFQTITSLYFILDYIPGGSLWTYLCSHPDTCLSEKNTRFYASEIILGVEELHKKKVVYRDLKPENILICKDGHIVLTDFGLSHNLKSSKTKVHSFSGTAIYISPEVLLEQGHDQVVDWWSLGIVIHLLLTGEPPFWSQNRKELFDMIKEGEIVIDNPLLSDNAKDLIIKLLDRNTSTRLGAREGAIELKRHPFFEGVDWDLVMKKGLTPPYVPRMPGEEKRDADAPCNDNLESKSARHKRNRSVDAFQGFSFTRQESGSSVQSDLKALKKFEIPKMKRNKITRRTNSGANPQGRKPSIDDVEGTASGGTKVSKKRGHRRSRSQCATSTEVTEIERKTTEGKSESKMPKLARLASVKLLRKNRNE